MTRLAVLMLLGLGSVGCSPESLQPVRTAFSDRLPGGDRPHWVTVIRTGDAIGYSGDLTPAGLEEVKRLDDPAARTFMVRSPGGEIGIAMDFGAWIHARGFDLVVVDYCVSSCANYVFPAGRTKTILTGGAVAWHGDALQQGLERDLAESLASRGGSDDEKGSRLAKGHAYLAAMQAKQAAFFDTIGVNECVCRVGNERFGAPGLFFMSVRDMTRFGINDVVAGPQREDDVAKDVRDKLDLTFVQIPAAFDAPAACAK